MLIRQFDVQTASLVRKVSIIQGDRTGSSPFILYCADGECTHYFAESFFREQPDQPIIFVGVQSGGQQLRNAEYVTGRNAEAFHWHEILFTQAVPEVVGRVLDLPTSPGQTGVFGYSCGGAFAASMGIVHRDLFSHTFCFSIAGRPVPDFSTSLGDTTMLTDNHYWMASGSREPGAMKNYMKRLGGWLKSHGASVSSWCEHGGHTLDVWSRALNHSLQQLLVQE